MAVYPQRLPMTEAERGSFLAEAPIARLGSLNSDGTVHIAALWFQAEGDEIVIGTQEITKKIQNIKRNPNVTVLIDVVGPPLKGVLIYGRAELDYDDVIEKRIKIFEKYMSNQDARNLALDLASQFEPVIIRIKPKRISSYDYAKEGLIQVA